ncbi:penicillin-binding protein activator [Desulfocurvus sp. DL9XJH121]
MKSIRTTPASPSPRTLRALALAVLILALVLGAGCAKRLVPTTPAPGEGRPAIVGTAQQAEQAWEAGDHEASEVLNRRLLDRGGLTAAERAEAWERLAVSALQNGHGHVALEALRHLAELRPSAPQTWQWNDVYLRALISIHRPDAARRHMDSLLRDKTRPWDLRFRAGLSLARDQWNERSYEQSMQTLARLYQASPAPAPVSRGRLERAFLEEFKLVDEATLTALASVVPPEAQWTFPYTIVRLEQARRYAAMEATRPQAWQLLNNLSRLGEFADQQMVAEVAAPLKQAYGPPTGGLVLALPLSGPYSEIGWKVLRGAGAAQWQALTQGAQTRIRVLNTEAPDWLDRLADLPEGFTVLGGPLRLDRFEQLVQRGQTGKHPCFAFLPRLTGAVEGMDAWRFFPGSHDEARALVGLAMDRMGVSQFGVLHPAEPYGERFSEVFRSEVEDRLGSVNATGSYPPDAPTKWAKSVAPFLGVDLAVPEEEREPVEPPFQAVFIPDSWSQAKILVPQLFFYDEDRLLVLGPSLWNQGLARDDNVEAHYFRTTAFPGAWWADNPAPGTAALRQALEQDGLGEPDFWVALGFDFVHFAGLMPPLPAAWSADSVNTALASAQGMDWSMAPLSWNDAGRARQELFLFRPTAKGRVVLDEDLLAKRLARVRENHAERVQMQKDKRELEELLKLQEADPTNENINMRLQLLKESIEERKQERP